MKFNKGCIPWNKGKTMAIDSRIKSVKKSELEKEKLSIRMKLNNPMKNKETAKKHGDKIRGIKNIKHSETMKKLFKEGILKPVLPKNSKMEDIYGKEKSDKIRKKISIKRIALNLNRENNPLFNKPNEFMKWHHKQFGHHMKGKHHTEETKQKLRNTNINMPIEERIRINNIISDKLKGRAFSQEHKIKIGLKSKGRKLSLESKEKIKKARALQIFPIKDTTIEVKIQNFLKELGYEFFTHKYIKEIEHGYQCDIFIPTINLVIECDGNYWHSYPTGNNIDHIRTKELLEKGFKVLRIWECEIRKMDINKFKEKINEI